MMKKYLKNIEWALFRLACFAMILALLTLNSNAQVIPVRLSTTFPYLTIVRNSLGVTPTDGILVKNTTSAAAGAQQYSPKVCWSGQGWKTTATAASQEVKFCLEVRPVQGSANPTGNITLTSSINGGAFSTVATFQSDGVMSAAATIQGTKVLYGTGNTALAQNTPSITSGFGTSPSIAGAASSFRVTVGSGGDTTGLVAFNTTFSNAPACHANNETTANLTRTTSTTTTVTVSGVMVASDKISIVCIGF